MTAFRSTCKSTPKKSFQRDVYFIGSKGGPIKIGMSCNLKRRLRELQAQSVEPLSVLAIERHGNSFMEGLYHQRFAEHHIGGEWFLRCPEIEATIARLNPRVAA
jgi:hypothetical protein